MRGIRLVPILCMLSLICVSFTGGFSEEPIYQTDGAGPSSARVDIDNNTLMENDIIDLYLYDVSAEDYDQSWRTDSSTSWHQANGSFPSSALLVLTVNGLDVIDAGNNYQSWMKFNQSDNNSISGNHSGMSTPTCVYAHHGCIFVGTTDGLREINYTHDEIHSYSHHGRITYNGSIAERNMGYGFTNTTLDVNYTIQSDVITDVHAARHQSSHISYLAIASEPVSGTDPRGVDVINRADGTLDQIDFGTSWVPQKVHVTTKGNLYVAGKSTMPASDPVFLLVKWDISSITSGLVGNNPGSGWDAFYSDDEEGDTYATTPFLKTRGGLTNVLDLVVDEGGGMGTNDNIVALGTDKGVNVIIEKRSTRSATKTSEESCQLISKEQTNADHQLQVGLARITTSVAIDPVTKVLYAGTNNGMDEGSVTAMYLFDIPGAYTNFTRKGYYDMATTPPLISSNINALGLHDGGLFVGTTDGVTTLGLNDAPRYAYPVDITDYPLFEDNTSAGISLIDLRNHFWDDYDFNTSLNFALKEVSPASGTHFSFQVSGYYVEVTNLEPDWFGPIEFWVTVTDSDGMSFENEPTEPIILMVSPTNDPPVIESIGGKDIVGDAVSFTNVMEGLDFEAPIIATDIDDDHSIPLSFYTNSANFTVVQDGENFNLTFQPMQAHVGDVSVNVTVDDGNGSTHTVTVNIQVVNVQDRPYFTKMGSKDVTGQLPEVPVVFDTLKQGVQFNLSLQAYDLDIQGGITDSLTFASNLTDHPTFILDPVTHNLTFTPLNDDVGTLFVNFTLKDSSPDGEVDDYQHIKFIIENVNDPPSIDSVTLAWTNANMPVPDSRELDLGSVTILEDEEYLIKVESSDPDLSIQDSLEELRYEKKVIDHNGIEIPAPYEKSTIEAFTGNFTFRPIQHHVNLPHVTVNITVLDTNNVPSWVILKIIVTNVNDPPMPPSISSPTHGQSFEEGEEITFIAGAVVDEDTGDNHTFTWDFGDGTGTVSGKTVTHTYELLENTESSNFRVNLTVTDTANEKAWNDITVTITQKEVIDGGNGDGEDDSNMMMIIMIIVIAAVAVGLGVFMMMRSKKAKAAKEAEEAAKRVAPAGGVTVSKAALEQALATGGVPPAPGAARAPGAPAPAVAPTPGAAPAPAPPVVSAPGAPEEAAPPPEDLSECGACGAFIPKDATACPECGASFQVEEEVSQCGSCGAIISTASEICPECGASFTEAEEEIPPPPVPSAPPPPSVPSVPSPAPGPSPPPPAPAGEAELEGIFDMKPEAPPGPPAPPPPPPKPAAAPAEPPAPVPPPEPEAEPVPPPEPPKKEPPKEEKKEEKKGDDFDDLFAPIS